MKKKQLAIDLYDIDAIKFGNFTLKSGIQSPVYIDLRVIVSYPKILKALSETIWEKAKSKQFDVICGVPYTALPVATYLSITHNIPMVMRRKEVKEYGTKKAIEGHFTPGQKCLVIEDLVTSGSSVFETIDPIEAEKLEVRDIIVFLDREQGGKENIEKRGYTCDAVFGMEELLQTLEANGRINQAKKLETLEFVIANRM